jgi:hypothetical protein
LKTKSQTLIRVEPLISDDELAHLFAQSDESMDSESSIQALDSHHVYMKFLDILLSNKSDLSVPTLSPDSQRLLELIAVRCELSNPLTVGQACLLREFGCASTIHTRLNKLQMTGLISLDLQELDRRKKSIKLTQFGKQYFQTIEKCLTMALKRL